MRKNGFTLIELLAVIVILAIIALIAVPIILNIINTAREESNKRSIELYASAVKNGIALSQLSTGKTVKSGIYSSSTLPFAVEYDGDVECATIEIYEDGTIYVEGCTVNEEAVEYVYGKNKGTGKPCTLEDLDKDGEASLSDVVTCGTESFYVMTNENNEITMLSMYNLDVGNIYDDSTGELEPIENPTNKQSELAKGWLENDPIRYGIILYSTTNYWNPNGEREDYPLWVYDENSNLYPYITEYERILKEEMKVNSAETSLISYEQLVELGCFANDEWTCGPNYNVEGNPLIENPAPEWIWATSYWTGSAEGSAYLWSVGSDGESYSDDCDNDRYNGVRPVVTISTAEI